MICIQDYAELMRYKIGIPSAPTEKVSTMWYYLTLLGDIKIKSPTLCGAIIVNR